MRRNFMLFKTRSDVSEAGAIHSAYATLAQRLLSVMRLLYINVWSDCYCSRWQSCCLITTSDDN